MISDKNIKNIIFNIRQKELKVDPDKNPDLYTLLQKANSKRSAENTAQWSPEEIAADMKIFSSHLSLLATQEVNEEQGVASPGEARPYITENSKFTSYLRENCIDDSQNFRDMMAQIYYLLYIASILDNEKKEELFYQFPPRSDIELQCLPGSMGRFDSVIKSFSQKTLVESAVYQSHISAINLLTQYVITYFNEDGASPLNDPGFQSYHVHIPGYIELFLGFVNQDQCVDRDQNSMLISNMLSAKIKAQIYDSYNDIFKREFMSIINDTNFYSPKVAQRISKAVVESISLANKTINPLFGQEIPRDFDISGVKFDDELTLQQYSQDNGYRVSSMLVKIAELLELDIEFFKNNCCDVSLDPPLYSINYKKLRSATQQKTVSEFLDEVKLLKGDDFKRRMSEINSSVALSEICKDLISGDVEKVKSAIDAFYLLSDDIEGAANIHFLKSLNAMITSTNQEGSTTMFVSDLLDRILSKNGPFQYLADDPHFSRVYYKRIKNPVAGSPSRSGILDRNISQYMRHQSFLCAVNSRVDILSNPIIANTNKIAIIAMIETEDLIKFFGDRKFYDLLSRDIGLIENFMSLISYRVDGSKLLRAMIENAPEEFLHLCQENIAIEDIYNESVNIISQHDPMTFDCKNINFIFNCAAAEGCDEGLLMRYLSNKDFNLGYKNYLQDSHLHQSLYMRGRGYNLSKALVEMMVSNGHSLKEENSRDVTPFDALILTLEEQEDVNEEDLNMVLFMLERGASLGGNANNSEVYDIVLSAECLSGEDKLGFVKRLAEIRNPDVNNFFNHDPIDELLKQIEYCDEYYLQIAMILMSKGSDILKEIDEVVANESNECLESFCQRVFSSDLLRLDQKIDFIDFLIKQEVSLEDNEILLKLITSSINQGQKLEIVNYLISNNIDLSNIYYDFNSESEDVPYLGIIYFAALNTSHDHDLEGHDRVFRFLLQNNASVDLEIIDAIKSSIDASQYAKDFVIDVEKYRHDYLYQDDRTDSLERSLESFYQEYGDSLVIKSALLCKDRNGSSFFTESMQRLLELGDSLSGVFSGVFLQNLRQFLTEHKSLIPAELFPDFEEFIKVSEVNIMHHNQMMTVDNNPNQMMYVEGGQGKIESPHDSAIDSGSNQSSPLISLRSSPQSSASDSSGSSSPVDSAIDELESSSKRRRIGSSPSSATSASSSSSSREPTPLSQSQGHDSSQGRL